METILVVHKHGCGYCEKAISFLKSNNKKFSLIENKTKQEKKVMVYMLKNPDITMDTTYPLIFINKKYIGGYEELKQYFNL